LSEKLININEIDSIKITCVVKKTENDKATPSPSPSEAPQPQETPLTVNPPTTLAILEQTSTSEAKNNKYSFGKIVIIGTLAIVGIMVAFKVIPKFIFKKEAGHQILVKHTNAGSKDVYLATNKQRAKLSQIEEEKTLLNNRREYEAFISELPIRI
jgi:hypothetical protein